MSQSDRLRRLNLSLLYALHAILTSPTLTRAGHSIALSHPAMSLALRKLRDNFADELMVYDGRGRRLTALAQTLLPMVGRLLREADHLFSLDLAFDPATARRTITLAAPEAIEVMYLSRVMSVMLAQAPGIEIRSLPVESPDVGALFARGVDDVVVPEAMLATQRSAVPLFSQGLSCLVCLDHPSIGDRIDLAVYADARHAALAPEVEQLLVSPAMRAGPFGARNIVVRTDHYSALPNLLIGTELIVTLSDWLAQYLASVHPLKVVPPPFDVTGMTMFAQWEAHRDGEPLIRWIVDNLQGAVPANQRIDGYQFR